MRDFKELFMVVIKERFRHISGSFMMGKDSAVGIKKEKSKKGVLFIILAVCFLPLLVGVAFLMSMLGSLAVENGLLKETVSLIISCVQIAVLIFGMISIINTLYGTSDSEILFSLPIKPTTIFCAKMLYVYCVETLASLLLTLVTLVPIGIGAGVGVYYYILLLVSIFVLPLLPLLLAAILGVPMMFIVSLFKNKGAFSTVITCFLFGLVFLAYYFLLYAVMPQGEFTTQDIMQSILGFVEGMGKAVLPNYWLAGFLVPASVSDALTNFLFVVLADGALGALACFVASLVYKKSITKSIEGGKSGSSHKGRMETGDIPKQLFSREMKELGRNSSMGFYCYMQIVMAIVLPLVIFGMNIFSDGESAEELSELVLLLENYSGFICGAFTVIAMFFASMNFSATGAFSRENNNIGLLKSLPLTPQAIMDSKIKVGVLFNELAFIPLYVLTGISGLNPISLIPSFVVASLFGTAMVHLQVYFDLVKPRFHWKSVQEGLKNSYSSIASLLVLLVLFVIIVILVGFSVYLGLSVNLVIGQIVMWALLIGAAIATVIITRRTIFKKASYYFSKLDD